jgi:hypothetical protein
MIKKEDMRICITAYIITKGCAINNPKAKS